MSYQSQVTKRETESRPLKGRSKAPSLTPQVCAGINPKPQTCEQWMQNSVLVDGLFKAGIPLKSIAFAVGVSQSTVTRWHKSALWPQEIRETISRHSASFPANVLASLATRLWTDINPSMKGRQDKRRSGLPKVSLRSTVELLAKGGPYRRRRETLADHAAKMQELAQKERARTFKLMENVKALDEEKKQLEKQLSLHRIDEILRENASLKMALVKARAGAKVSPPKQKSPDILHLEDRLRSLLQCRVDLDHSSGILVVNGGNREIIEAVIERIMRM